MIISLGIAVLGLTFYFNGWDTGWRGLIAIMAWTCGYMSTNIIWGSTLDRIKQLEKALEEKEESK